MAKSNQIPNEQMEMILDLQDQIDKLKNESSRYEFKFGNMEEDLKELRKRLDRLTESLGVDI